MTVTTSGTSREASALTGTNARSVRILDHFADTVGPDDSPSEILISRRCTSQLFTALISAAASHVVEQDDVHIGAVFHPAPRTIDRVWTLDREPDVRDLLPGM